eukprot:CAMPEP_0185028546 /NCGR_PEP_ID=MMETSP1103-20130426/14320_1 /TAXON_ID=36769 /ORGANISM="Paraphysomonas bandaiensis, Strain Caron Lab Isolate" /LENGTH=333 /DNA_ID=CAMNT_0027562991 /DNA_START=98 /DNA_END=1099 /DNA_ORIENTATION=+
MGGFNHSQLQRQYDLFQQYKIRNEVTVSSMLIYSLNADGSLGFWETGDDTWSSKQFQRDLKTNLGLKAYPCLFCDETIGNCEPLPEILSLLANDEASKQQFIRATIEEAITWGWDGYSVDFESFNHINFTETTPFVLEWGEALSSHNLSLSVWIGGSADYDLADLNASPYIESIVSMDTYGKSYDSFVWTAETLLSEVSPSKAGFGLLTSTASVTLLPDYLLGKAPDSESNRDTVISFRREVGHFLLKKFPSIRGAVKSDILNDTLVQQLGAYVTSGSSNVGFTHQTHVVGSVDGDDMQQIAEWIKDHDCYGMSIWASEIPSQWEEAFVAYNL